MAIGMSMSNYSACHSAARGGGKFSGVDGGSNDSFIACVALLCTVSPIAIGTVFLVDKCSGAADRRAERRVEYQKILQDSVMFEKAEKRILLFILWKIIRNWISINLIKMVKPS